jgi:hypothetical protein
LQLDDLPEGSSAFECDAVGRTVEFSEGMVLEVPPARVTVGASGIDANGMGSSFAISTAADGEITYEVPGGGKMLAIPTEAAVVDEDHALATSETKGCNYADYGLIGASWTQGYVWYIGDGRRPDSMTTSQVTEAFFDAANAIVDSRNPCGYSDEVTADWSYGGGSGYESDMRLVDGGTKCYDYDDRDEWSVVDFGDLANHGRPWVAYTCTYWYRSSMVEADVRFNVVDHSFTGFPRSDNCNNEKYDLQSVATHEFGHVWGLDDLYSFAARYQTMYGYMYKCRLLARSLAKSDVLGLRSMY